ncbi:hypothetical protein [Methylobacterium oxalidis]|uniref:hypothetical protein n=1 Tax=Methylobacterium oxalidis TaxID=944322 RepID=UPI003314C935
MPESYPLVVERFIVAKLWMAFSLDRLRASALALNEGEEMLADTPDDTIQPEGSLPHRYRAFILDADGKVLRLAPVSAQDDEAALRLASAMVDGHSVELWDGMRFIEHLDPHSFAK